MSSLSSNPIGWLELLSEEANRSLQHDKWTTLYPHSPAHKTFSMHSKSYVLDKTLRLRFTPSLSTSLRSRLVPQSQQVSAEPVVPQTLVIVASWYESDTPHSQSSLTSFRSQHRARPSSSETSMCRAGTLLMSSSFVSLVMRNFSFRLSSIFFAMNSFIDPAICFFPVIWNFFVSSFRRQFGGDTLDWLVVTFLSPRRRHWVHDGVTPFFSRPCYACAVCFLWCLVYLNVCLHLFSYTRVKNKMVEQTCRALVHSSISS